MSPSFLKQFLTFGHSKMFQAHLELSHPSPRITHFSKEPWILLLANGIYKPKFVCKVCSLLLEHCYFQASQWTELENRYMSWTHTSVYMYINVNKYVYMYMPIYISTHPFIHPPIRPVYSNTIIPTQHCMVYSIFSPFPICHSLLWQWETWLALFTMYLLI